MLRTWDLDSQLRHCRAMRGHPQGCSNLRRCHKGSKHNTETSVKNGSTGEAYVGKVLPVGVCATVWINGIQESINIVAILALSVLVQGNTYSFQSPDRLARVASYRTVAVGKQNAKRIHSK